MALQVGTMAQQIAAEVPGLPPLLARTYINRAMREICNDYLWSWMVQEGVLIVPPIINGGKVTTTFGLREITFNADAQALIAPTLLANPPFIERQFRIGGSGPIYNISGYDANTGVCTLDRVYTESTAVDSAYSVYKCYYGPPSIDGITPNTDFVRYLTINNPINGYTISGKALYWSRKELNRRDPMRGAVGTSAPYVMAAYRPTPNGLINGVLANGPSTGIMMYEAWPHPTASLGLLCQYQRQYTDLGPSAFFPNQMVDTIVYYKAKYYGCQWAQMNAGTSPALRAVDWRFSIAQVEQTFKAELATAKMKDKEITSEILRPGTTSSNFMGQWGPIDSRFAQSHDYPAWMDAFGM